MPVIDILQMKEALAPGGRLLALDVGSKTIGLAISDSALKVAAPLTVFERGKFAANLLKVIDLPFAFWDERFSTIAAERPLREAEMSHRRRGAVVDKLAAAYLLQGALDRLAAVS